MVAGSKRWRNGFCQEGQLQSRTVLCLLSARFKAWILPLHRATMKPVKATRPTPSATIRYLNEDPSYASN
jgi:hypothetical protein